MRRSSRRSTPQSAETANKEEQLYEEPANLSGGEHGAEDNAGHFFDGVEYATYQEMVNAKRKRNQQVLLSSGLLESAAALKTAAAVSSSKTKPQTKGIKKRKSTSDKAGGAVVQRRKSNRIAGVQSDGKFVDEEQGGRFTVASNGGGVTTMVSQGNDKEEPEPEFYRGRVNDGSPLSLTDVVELTGSKWIKENSLSQAQTFVGETLSSRILTDTPSPSLKRNKSPRSVAGRNESSEETLERMAATKITSEAIVAKVVPDRIYSVAAHPSTNELIVAAGDKNGYVGIWNVDSRAKDEDNDGNDNDGAHLFKFHSGSAICLQWTATGNALFSASYDGTVRLFDVASQSVEQVFATYDSTDCYSGELGYGLDTGYRYWTQYGCLDHRSDSDKCFFLSTSKGTAMHVDMRTRGRITFHEDLSEKKINTLSLHANGYSLASAGLDCAINIWDVRKFSDNRASGRARAPKAVSSYTSGRSVNSAFFSPSGKYLLSTTMGDKLDLLENAHVSTNLLQPSASIRHNNQTGRWLSTLMANWHPAADVFAVGCLKQPRRIELMDGTGKTMQELQGENLTAVCSRCCFHPSTDQTIVVGGNSSGRVTVFRS